MERAQINQTVSPRETAINQLPGDFFDGSDTNDGLTFNNDRLMGRPTRIQRESQPMDATTDIHNFVRIYLALFFTFVAVFYSLRILYRMRHDGQVVVFPGQRFSATWWNHFAFRWFRIFIWAICVFRAIEPGVDRYLGMIGPLQHNWLILSGAVCLTLGFGLALAGHFSLGMDWRSGIDRISPSSLRVTDMYRHSRNPAFLGVAFAQFGFFLALPSLFSAVCLVVGVLTLYRQALSEEQHLETIFNSQYRDYRRKVRRWI
ncbi:methyltransferase family protein [Ruegeria atlantica]|nr:isoprenylcysteine carboxylmethyltransferase family protein [Ruegeria atlantica]